MPANPLSPTKKILAVLLPFIAAASWKMGQPTPATAAMRSPAKSPAIESKTCCEKPPTRAALLQQKTPPQDPHHTPAPQSPTPAPSSP